MINDQWQMTNALGTQFELGIGIWSLVIAFQGFVA